MLDANQKHEHGPLKTHFFFLVMGRNCEKWISRSFKSLLMQKHRDFTCMYVDDASSDRSFERAKRIVGSDSRFRIQRNEERRYTLCNRLEAVSRSGAGASDVFVVLDADDWLSDKGVLSYVADAYQNPNVWITHGSYLIWRDLLRYRLGLRKKRGISNPFKSEVIKRRTFRQQPISASHLRTFRRFLWDAIPPGDLLDQRGDLMKCTEDFATMIPMLEMAGGSHSLHIDRVMYYYNESNPRGVMKSNRQAQLENEAHIRSLSPRPLLDFQGQPVKGS